MNEFIIGFAASFALGGVFALAIQTSRLVKKQRGINEELMTLIRQLNDDINKLKRFADVEAEFAQSTTRSLKRHDRAIAEAAEWAFGVDAFRREVLADHPKIRNRMTASSKADAAVMTADAKKKGDSDGETPQTTES